MAVRIVFVVNHPTQFEVPFYKHIKATELELHWEVWYLNAKSNEIHDSEIKSNINWGFNLYEGYNYRIVSEEMFSNVGAAIQDVDLLILNGYKGKYKTIKQIADQSGKKVFLRLDTAEIGKSALQMLFRRLILSSVYNSFDKLMVTGTVSKNYLLKIGIRNSKIGWFPYCTNNKWFYNINNTEKQAHFEKLNIQPITTILSVCKFSDRENPFELLDAFIGMNDENLQLIMIGDGPQYNQLTRKANASPNLKIIFPGYIQYSQLAQWFSISNLFVHVAKDEPWGVSIQEAIASGCAVVYSSGVGSGIDLVVEGSNGYTYKTNDISALQKAIKKALQIPVSIKSATNSYILSKWNYESVWQSMKSFIASSTS